MSIYVELTIRCGLDKIWTYTQTPVMHERWDARFHSIQYLHRPDPEKPQQFLYSTRLGFGLAINGKGETAGSRNGFTGCRTSALKFWSDDPKSLIEEGSGYWQYAPVAEGIRFSTQYNYKTRFGLFGARFDRLIFRPLMGWATAWSFDRLRLWIEKGIDPAISMERSLVHATSRLTLAFVWIYQGMVPKLLFRDSGELEILSQIGFLRGYEPMILTLAGVGEIVFGVMLLVLWRSRKLLIINILLMIGLGAGSLLSQPKIFVAPFNPLTLNLALAALAGIGLCVSRDLPSASACLRKRTENPK